MKKICIILLVLVVLFSLAACGSSGGNSETKLEESEKATELTIAIERELQGFDPHQITAEDPVHLFMNQSLFVYSKDNSQLLPSLVESFEISEDGLRIDFTLPKDLKFSNGDPLTAQSVKDSISRFLEISPYAEDQEVITDIEVIDDQHGALILAEPAPYMYPSLASVYGSIVDVKVAEEVGEGEFNGEGFVSCGPYMVQEWTAGSDAVLVPNPYYVNNNPEIQNHDASALYEKITIRTIPDSFTRVSELQAGNVDITYVGTSDYAAVLDDESLKKYQYDFAGMIYSLLNHQEGILTDVNVRKAICLAIDRNAITEGLGNTAAPSYGLLSGAMIGYSAEEETKLAGEFGPDPEKAKELLAESGWSDSDGDGILEKDGQPLHIKLIASTRYEIVGQMAPIIQDQLKQVGIDAEINLIEHSLVGEAVKEGDYDMMIGQFSWTDADILIYLSFNSDEVTEVLTEARGINDPAARTAKYAEAQNVIMDGMLAMGICYPLNLTASTANVTMELKADGTFYINDVVKTK